MTLRRARNLAASASGRTTAFAPPAPQPHALGCTPSFRDLQRTVIYLQDLIEAAACSSNALQVQLEERTRQFERAAAEIDAMRQEAEMEREAAAAWRAERQSILRLHAVRAEEVATARRGHEAVESQLLAVESLQLEQHMLLLAQERHLKDERAARLADAVGMRGLQHEVRSLEAQLERAASEHVLQRQHIATLQQTYMYALGGVCRGEPKRAAGASAHRRADTDAPYRAREEVRKPSSTIYAGHASLVPAPATELLETVPQGVDSEHLAREKPWCQGRTLGAKEGQIPTRCPSALLMWWSNPEG